MNGEGCKIVNPVRGRGYGEADEPRGVRNQASSRESGEKMTTNGTNDYKQTENKSPQTNKAMGDGKRDMGGGGVDSCGPMLNYKTFMLLEGFEVVFSPRRWEAQRNLTDGLPTDGDENQIGPHSPQASDQDHVEPTAATRPKVEAPGGLSRHQLDPTGCDVFRKHTNAAVGEAERRHDPAVAPYRRRTEPHWAE